ncbi:hypothetical protein HPB49_017337 [Dermacentor silvarum]|uniref:Uncharacterized protein n=1 Tax=Dermacentor silvarum TaxID=543639 RepID=A0ACB8CM16_DERSI|nr:hypothetical protein HPB49_017337 [Dermacentor silvarum]
MDYRPPFRPRWAGHRRRTSDTFIDPLPLSFEVMRARSTLRSNEFATLVNSWLVRQDTAVFEPSLGHESSTDDVLMPQVTNTTTVKSSATPPADLPPGDLNLPQQLETTTAPSALLCNEERTTSLNPVTAIPSLSVPLPPSSDSEEEMDTAMRRKRRRECEDGVDDAAPCKQLPPPAAEAMTIQAAFVAEPLQQCAEDAASSEKVVARASSDRASLGTTTAARQLRPSSSTASAALLTMAPAHVFTALLGDAVTAAPKPHDAATVRKHDSSGRASLQEGGFTMFSPRSHHRHPRGPVRETTIPPVMAVLPDASNKAPARNIAGTAVFRPAVAGASFCRTSRLTITEVLLSALPDVVEVRVNMRLDSVAVDADSSGCLQNLLAPTELAGIAVCTGFVHGVGRDISDHDLLTAVYSSVPVMSVRRSGDTVSFRFAATSPPECINPYRMPFLVKSFRARLVQCVHCGRYGNTTTACVFPEMCLRRSARWRRWLLLPPVLSVDKKREPRCGLRLPGPRRSMAR